MRGILRLIRGLQEGDPEAVYVLIFAIVGTAVIVLTVALVRRRRNRQDRSGR